MKPNSGASDGARRLASTSSTRARPHSPSASARLTAQVVLPSFGTALVTAMMRGSPRSASRWRKTRKLAARRRIGRAHQDEARVGIVGRRCVATQTCVRGATAVDARARRAPRRRPRRRAARACAGGTSRVRICCDATITLGCDGTTAGIVGIVCGGSEAAVPIGVVMRARCASCCCLSCCDGDSVVCTSSSGRNFGVRAVGPDPCASLRRCRSCRSRSWRDRAHRRRRARAHGAWRSSVDAALRRRRRRACRSVRAVAQPSFTMSSEVERRGTTLRSGRPMRSMSTRS